MAISHNPILNRAVSTQLSQSKVDAEFDNLVNNPPMTIEGTVSKAFISFLILVATAIASWIYQPLNALVAVAYIPLLFVGLGLGIYNSFAKRVGAVSVGIYSAVEGLILGALSMWVDSIYPGVAMQAIVATLVTAGGMFFAYRTGIIKVTPGFTKVMGFAVLGYLLFSVVNLVISMFNPAGNLFNSEFGWAIALLGAGLAAFSLNLDFAAIKQGAEQRLPRELEWRFAFGLMSTLIWLYVEILRLLTIFNRD